MHVTLDYRLGPEQYLAWHGATNPGHLTVFRKSFFTWWAMVAAPSLLGLVQAIRFGSEGIALVFVALLVTAIVGAGCYKGEHRKAVAAQFGKLPVQAVNLTVDDAGLHETVAGVQSFAPWASVLSLTDTPELLALKLSSGHHCLIPVVALGTAAMQAEFRAFVSSKMAPQQEASRA